MKKVLDGSGAPISTLLRDDVGALVVSDNSGYAKYMQEQERQKQIKKLTEDVEFLKSAMVEILQELRNKNG